MKDYPDGMSLWENKSLGQRRSLSRRGRQGNRRKRKLHGSKIGMNDTHVASDKPKRIQQLWPELGRTTLKSAECSDIIKRIRSLSAEYQSPVEGSQKRAKSK